MKILEKSSPTVVYNTHAILCVISSEIVWRVYSIVHNCIIYTDFYHLRGGHKSTTATTEEGGQLIVTGVYGLVRHPMYTGILVLLWSQPSMVGRRGFTCIADFIDELCGALRCVIRKITPFRH